MKKMLAVALAVVMSAMTLTACGAKEAGKGIEGTELMVFSGAGLADPVQEIADAFMEETGCDVQIVFAATGQLISQIQSTESGDVILAGAKDELKNMNEGVVTETVELVKHIPVLIVQKGNPSNIQSIADLGNDGMKVLIPDPETTPIGKIGMKAYEEAGILDSIDVAANTTTAPLALTAIAQAEGDGAIVWKENASKNDKVEILDVPEMEKYVKIVPAASLKFSTNEAARVAFVEFLSGEKGMEIWQKYGYEPAK